MQITRRSALATGAAAITTAAITAPLAIKAGATKAALVGDPQVAALIGQLATANADYDANLVRCTAVLDLIPRAAKAALAAYRYPAAAPQDVQDTYNQHYEASGVEALDEEREPIMDRISAIQQQIIQTPASTLRGTLGKARIFWNITAAHEDLNETAPDLDRTCCPLDDPVLIWSILQDLERLAGGRPL